MWLCTTVKALTNGFHTERFVSNPHWAYYYSRIFHKNFPGGAWNGDQSGEVVHRMLRRPITCRCFPTLGWRAALRLKGCWNCSQESISITRKQPHSLCNVILPLTSRCSHLQWLRLCAVQFLYLNGVGSTMVQKFMFKTIFFQSLRTKKVIQPVHS